MANPPRVQASPFGSRAKGLRLERMQASPRYRDGGFRNTAPVGPGLRGGKAVSTFGEFLFGGQRRTPRAPLPAQSPLEAWAKPPSTGFRATWLGHSTVLLELEGARVLTDPVWGERASPFARLGPKRFQPVPVPLSALPPLDAVLLSHDHYDHLDLPTLLELARRPVPFFAPLGVGAHLESWGIPPERITELDWWDEVQLPGTELVLTAGPAQHFSGRGMGDRNATLWCSLSLRGPRHSVFFSGDTGLTSEYEEIHRRLGRFDLVMLEVGAYHPAWGDIHLGPANALTALELLGGGSLLPVHWGTFNLAIHAWDEPAEELLRLAPSRGAHLLTPQLGQAIEPLQVESVEPWWRAVEGLAPSPAPEPVPEAAGDAATWPVGEPLD